MTKKEVSQRKQIIKDYFTNNPKSSNRAAGRALGLNESIIRRYVKILNLNKDKTSTIKSDIADNKHKASLKNLQAKYNQLLKLLEEKDSELAALIDINKANKNADIATPKSNKREVVPVVVASDWHIEEKVSAAITNGLNEYSLDIAEDSIKQFFNNAITLINREKRDSVVKTVVLAILGDIINGVLRDEDLENNQTSSIDALSIARSLIYSGIKKMEQETGCKIVVICCVGNHGRMTEKIHYSNQIHNSLEYLIYKTLERDFRDHDNVEFHVSEAPYFMQKIFGIRIRYHHGHCCKYHSGIGGLGVPVLRKVAQMNLIEKADLDVIGHFHSMQIFSNVIINGSLVGSNGYSMSLGLPYEPPQQTFFLIDSKYGRSIVTPIFIDRDIKQNDMSIIE